MCVWVCVSPLMARQAVGALYDDIDEAEAELWSFAEDRGERAVSLLQGLRHDGWVEQRTRAVCAVAEALMACEVNRVMNESGVLAQVADTVLPTDASADAGCVLPYGLCVRGVALV